MSKSPKADETKWSPKDEIKSSGKSSSSIKRKGTYFLVLVLLFGLILHLNGVCVPAAVFASLLCLQTGMQGFYGLGLLIFEPLNPDPVSDYVKMGYFRSLKFKFIYVSRFLMKDNFLFENWLGDLQKDFLHELEASGARKGSESTYDIPTFDYNDMDPMVFFSQYVRRGKPCILKNAPIKAMKWTADNLASRAGDFTTSMRCMDGSVRKYSLAEYVASRSGKDACYFDNNANIFEAYPELESELEMDKFFVHMSGKNQKNSYLFSQMFLSVFNTTGALFHCANYNNLFFMIQGRKRWTFVDPSNSFMMYPMFNSMFKDSKSWLTWHVMHANNSQQLIDENFPLYNYAPKYVSVLEPGDILINPTWNWHQVENLDADSIGIASRWLIPQIYPYTNGLFSFLQFVSIEFQQFIYRRVAQKFFGRGEFVYAPTSHGNVDFNLNYNNTGTVYQRAHQIQKLVSQTQWSSYIDYLKSISYDFDQN